MLASSVQAVVATALRVFTLVMNCNQLISIFLENLPFKKFFGSVYEYVQYQWMKLKFLLFPFSAIPLVCLRVLG